MSGKLDHARHGLHEQLIMFSCQLRARAFKLSRSRLKRLDYGDKMMFRDRLMDVIRELDYLNEILDAGCSVIVDNLREDYRKEEKNPNPYHGGCVFPPHHSEYRKKEGS